MSMIAKENAGVNIPNLDDGVYTAVSQMIIDLGIQRNEKFDKDQRKFMLIWNIVGETIKIGEEELPRIITKEYSFSLSDKSNLRKDLEAWRGQAFTQDELLGFDILNILNKGCQLQIINKETNGKSYNNIAGIMALAKGMKVEQLEETTVLDLENPDTWKSYTKIPNWIQEKIKKAINLATTGFDKHIEECEITKKENDNQEENNQEYNNLLEPVTDDDLPF